MQTRFHWATGLNKREARSDLKLQSIAQALHTAKWAKGGPYSVATLILDMCTVTPKDGFCLKCFYCFTPTALHYLGCVHPTSYIMVKVLLLLWAKTGNATVLKFLNCLLLFGVFL